MKEFLSVEDENKRDIGRKILEKMIMNLITISISLSNINCYEAEKNNINQSLEQASNYCQNESVEIDVKESDNATIIRLYSEYSQPIHELYRNSRVEEPSASNWLEYRAQFPDL